MSTPFSLRICCIAAMAPALTDAASQAKIKFPGTPVSPSKTSLLDGGEAINQPVKNDVCEVLNPMLLGSKTIIKLPTTLHHFPEGICVKEARRGKKLHSSSCNSINQEIPIVEKSFFKPSKPSAFQQEFLKSINIFDRMNQSVPVNGKQHSGKNIRELTNSDIVATDLKLNFTNGNKDENQKCAGNVDNSFQGCHFSENDNVQNFRAMGNKNNLVNDTANVDKLTYVKDKYANHNEDFSELLSTVNTPRDPERMPIVSSSICVSHQGNQEYHCTRESSTMPQSCKREKLRSVIETSSEMDLRLQSSKTLAQLERRVEFYMRRVRRLQGREIEEYIRNQINLCIEHHRKNLQTVTRTFSAHNPLGLKKSELDTNILNKSLSTAALVNLVQQAQKQASQNTTSEISAKGQEMTNTLNMDKKTRKECQMVSDQLAMNIHHAETVVDSDATESSSGGESCDENDSIQMNNRKLQKPLYKRAEWKWCVERASVASRWTWLQAQVSDLEYRIRQQSDIYKQIRQSKGSIVLCDPPSPPNLMKRSLTGEQGYSLASRDQKNEMSPSCNITNFMSNVDKQANRLTLSLGNVLSPSSSFTPLNGLVESPYPLKSEIKDSGNQDVSVCMPSDGGSQYASPMTDFSCQAARCRPLRSYRKRKLLKTKGLYLSSHKAARLSTVNCHCYFPVTSCPLCGGRYNNKLTVDAELMPLRERVSLLDSSFHPVLSFPNDVPLLLHFESLIKTGDWMEKMNKNPNKCKKRKYKTHIIHEPKRKINKNAAAALLQSAKIKNKYENKSMKRAHNSVLGWSSRTNKKGLKDNKRRNAAKLTVVAMKRHARNASTDSSFSSTFKDGNLSSSYSSSMLKEMRAESLRKRRGESAYDINNIVIPYSIAAATRVEKLQYKEIATPEWRDVSQEYLDEISDQQETDCEDMSDAAFSMRHQKCEAEEKKRFASFIQYPVRRRIRTEVGSSTPEFDSPDALHSDTFTHTPLPQETRSSFILTDGDESLSSEHTHRRNSSTSKRYSISSTIDDQEPDFPAIEPWAPRTFPLTETDYDEMKAVEPHVYEKLPVVTQMQSINNIDSSSHTDTTPSSSRPSSPIQSIGTNSVDDDPNDPEWTGDMNRSLKISN